MKRVTLLSIVAASLLFTGCGEDAKKAANDVANSAKTAASQAVAATKEVASNAAQATKEVAADAANKAHEAASDAVQATKEVAANAANKAQEAVAGANNEKGKALFAKCAACHGADGKTKALNKSELLAGQSAEEIATKLNEYKVGTRDINGMGTLMKGQASSLSDDDIKAVAEYIATFK